MEPILEHDVGAVRGARETGLLVFRGVPYAAPPVAELRFEPPRLPRRWQGARDATRFGPAPLQDADWMDAWIAFAREGDPSHAGVGPWPRYTGESRETMVFGEKSGAWSAPFEAERAAWDALPGRVP